MAFHHFVSKSFIKHWQPSYDSKLANRDKSNGGVYLHDVIANKTEHERNLQTVFAEEDLNHPDVENKISAFIEKYLGKLDELEPKIGEVTSITPNWKRYRAIVLLTLLQASRIPGEQKPFINDILQMNENDIDLLTHAHGTKKKVIGVKLPENLFMFLNEKGFFIFPAMNFQNREQILKGNSTFDIWGVAVPIRPDFCFISVSNEFADLEWIKSNMHIFQTYSVGLNCERMIAPPRLKDGGEFRSGDDVKQIMLQECILDFQRTVQAANDLVVGWFTLHELEKKFATILASSLK